MDVLRIPGTSGCVKDSRGQWMCLIQQRYNETVLMTVTSSTAISDVCGW